MLMRGLVGVGWKRLALLQGVEKAIDLLFLFVFKG
jgi:hypothetical protein